MEKVKNEQGSISLFFLILLPVTVLLLFVLFSNAQVNKNELDFIRRCENEMDLLLGTYNRQLWHDFGLWGTDQNSLDLYRQELDEHFVATDFVVNTTVSAEQYLTENEQFKKQIGRQMNLRAPIYIVNDILSRNESYYQLTDSIARQKDILSSMDIFDQPQGILQHKEDYLAEPTNEDNAMEPAETGSETDANSKEISEKENSELQNKGFAIIEDLLKDAESSLIPVYESMGTSTGDNDFSMNALAQIFASLDHLSINQTIPLLDRIEVNEYLFRYYTLACSEIERNEMMLSLRTPDGRKHKDLIENGRKNEIEQIVFQADDAEQALKKSKNTMYALCFSYHLFYKLTDSYMKNLYLTEATALSGSIALISGGTVIIDPNSLVYLITLADALKDTGTDIDKLFKGQNIIFKIGDSELKMNYYDLLYTIALFSSEDQLLAGMTRIREQIIPGTYCVAFKMQANFENKQIVFRREFSDHLEEIKLE